ncbi:putative ferredoxin [Herminiimonas arsenicoxydans]|uniref:Ferredoxin n=1 Tax=Herminiimonas arsenicoxydans TaxID=204773 RepID=A4G4Z4_HERAR|nr:putative ferredoxin [Herminiimonas arsenicoxydans]
MTTEFKVCNCNRTMPLDAAAGTQLGAALGTAPIPIATELCRREVGTYLKTLDGVDDVVVACTQERSLFVELAQQKGTVAPLRFVNIRETGGWSAQAGQALPKMAALLAAAALPDPEPVPIVNYDSAGHVLIIGPADQALPWAQRLREQVDVSVLLTSGSESQMLGERSFPSFSGKKIKVDGWLGAFNVRWQQDNPIDLESCIRCNACIEVCPESAIDLTYQIDLDKCRSHGDCVKACGSIGAINFARGELAGANERNGEFDLIFDLSSTPLVHTHQLPQGYFAPGQDVARQFEDSLKLTQMVGQFEKPKFFSYKEKLCAHSRNGKIGCNACIEICSAEAISHNGNHVKVNPNLCAGCGACTTVCPSGAMAYAYPRTEDMGLRVKTLLNTYAKAGGRQAGLLFHSKGQGATLIAQAGRLAKAGWNGIPARIIPVELHHTAAVGIDVWLAAFAYGAANVSVMVTDEEAPQYLDALQQQMELAQTIMSGLGYAGVHVQLIRINTAAELDTYVNALAPAQTTEIRATFNVAADKRTTLEFALDHLHRHAPISVEQIALPAGSLYGAVVVNRDACTLCMSCVGACPESALTDNANAPQLRFIEKNCVQCGLCEKTCPENAITLVPRLLLTPAAKELQVLNEAEPFHCISCQKPFGTAKMIENMVGKLSMHGAFSGNINRLKMCPDCRVVDMMANKQESSVSDFK